MSWKDRELKSKQVLSANITDNEKEIIKTYINCAIKENQNPNGRGQYFDGIQTGIVQCLSSLGRADLLDLIIVEYSEHDELM